MTAISAGALPLYGTAVRPMPAMDFSISTVTAPVAPGTPMLNRVGSLRAADINSLKLRGAIFGCARSTEPNCTSWDTGTKSRTGS